MGTGESEHEVGCVACKALQCQYVLQGSLPPVLQVCPAQHHSRRWGRSCWQFWPGNIQAPRLPSSKRAPKVGAVLRAGLPLKLPGTNTPIFTPKDGAVAPETGGYAAHTRKHIGCILLGTSLNLVSKAKTYCSPKTHSLLAIWRHVKLARQQAKATTNRSRIPYAKTCRKCQDDPPPPHPTPSSLVSSPT